MGRPMMRRFVSLFILVSALSLIATVSGSSGAAVGAVSGAGKFSSGAHFSVSAGKGPDGRYSYQRPNPTFSLSGQVQCVFQSGTFAAVGGTITNSSIASNVTMHFLVYFSGQKATTPNIDPENDPDVSGLLPAGFPA